MRRSERILSLFAIVAVAWLGAVVADLAINKPLGLSPPGIEFKRAHLYDINPVGTGAMALAAAIALLAATGWFGAMPQALAPFVALGTALLAAPALAIATRGRFYLARKPRAAWMAKPSIACSICSNPFEPEDMAYCPAYAAPICSLCCSLDARCHDLCKPHARAQAQIATALWALLPRPARPADQRQRLALPRRVHAADRCHRPRPAADRRTGGLLWHLRGRGGRTHALGRLCHPVDRRGDPGLVLRARRRKPTRRAGGKRPARRGCCCTRSRRTSAPTPPVQKAKEVAEAPNLAKSRYVIGLSHELRTPLNAVLGYAQLLERDDGVAAARQNGVRVIRRSAEHLSGLIDGLLDVSKIEAGRLQIQRGEIRTADFFASLADMFRLQASAKGLGVRFDGVDTLPTAVRTDEKRLRQILINLLSNAIKFTREGEVALEVSYRNQIATVTVEDTGPGIAEADLGRIFDPFDRGALTGSEAIPGLGLGLTITRLLCDLMGGEITVSSKPGQGSTFRLRLMLAAVQSPAAKLVRNVQGYMGHRRTLLVVDDDQDHQALMRAMLEPLGFSVLTARDAVTCLAMVDDVGPDLLFLDISMPGMNGWDLARTLRTSKAQKAPIIMLSANIGDSFPEPGEGDAHSGTLPKPFDLARLLDALERQLDLVWIEGVPPAQVVDPVLTSARPPSSVIDELLRLGAIGYVRGIETRLDDLAEEPGLRFLSARLRDRIRAFDFAGYAAVLEELKEPEPAP